ncbi:MAG TPA: peptidoglycan-binding domain-containing protein [Actinomycetes bacterium]|nr:peptidoglycan-binding domain-containing protein [Actinomycetes bacterium]
MTMNFATWQGAEHCTGGASPGARALMAWSLEQFDDDQNLGIFNCRNVVGGNTTSCHGEGRACDVGYRMIGADANPNGLALVRKLGEHGQALGIQAMIFDRVIYSAKSPDGRPYEGTAPHKDHVHIELTRKAADHLTLATIRHAMGQTAGPKPPTPPFPIFGERSARVTFVQRKLKALGFDPGPIDGIFGRLTKAGVARFQAAHKELKGNADGVFGPKTWAALQAA